MSLGRRMLFVIPLLIALLVMVGLFVPALNNDPTLLPSTRVDQQVPNFSLSTLQQAEKIINQGDLQGPLLLNVWATWCPSCRIEHPILNELAQNGIKIIGLNYKDEREAALKYLQLNGNPYQYNLYDEKGYFGLDLGVYGAPETFLIDAHGIIKHRHVGVVSRDVWQEQLWPIWQSMGGIGPERAEEATQ